MILPTCWRPAVRCGEDILKGLEQLLQHDPRINDGASNDSLATHAGPVMGASIEPECHQKGGEVPDDGSQCPQPLDAKDEVERAQIQREAVDGEALVMDADVNGGAGPRAAHTVTVDH